MTRLAERLGLSGRGLAKMCERHQVPRPGRGYWQKKQHRHSVEPTPLPELEEDEEKLSTVRFSRQARSKVEESDGEGEFASVTVAVAARLAPRTRDYRFISHRSAEPGHQVLLEALDLDPL